MWLKYLDPRRIDCIYTKAPHTDFILYHKPCLLLTCKSIDKRVLINCDTTRFASLSRSLIPSALYDPLRYACFPTNLCQQSVSDDVTWPGGSRLLVTEINLRINILQSRCSTLAGSLIPSALYEPLRYACFPINA